LSSLRYRNLFKVIRSLKVIIQIEEFKDPIEFSFDNRSTICGSNVISKIVIAVVKYSWCKKSLCLKHFFIHIIIVMSIMSKRKQNINTKYKI